MKTTFEIIGDVRGIEKQCPVCGVTFTALGGIFAKLQTLCPVHAQEHADAVEAERTAATLAARVEKWRAICPPDYRNLRRELLPLPEKLDEVIAWQRNPKGLILHGATGHGKTRCAWALLEREFIAERSVRIMDSMAGLRYASMFSRGAENVEEWVNGVIDAQIVLLDDVFKNKLTDSFEGVVFTIIDQRIQYRRPVIVTCNDTEATLITRMSADRGEPMMRRLRDHCTPIQF